MSRRRENPSKGDLESDSNIDNKMCVDEEYEGEDDAEEEVVVAATRIEAMLGYAAVAVHPGDPGCRHLHGRTIVHPFVEGKLPVVSDTFVDMSFGAGAVEVAPARDPNDEGCAVGGCGQFGGVQRFVAGRAALEALQEKGLYVEAKDSPIVVPLCSRFKDVIEPTIKPQWYVHSEEMAEGSIGAVTSGDLELVPKIHEETWFHWMSEVGPWCISRQLWWGHGISVCFVVIKGQAFPQAQRDVSAHWISAASMREAIKRACLGFKTAADGLTLERDPDVLDAWFGSGWLPFSVNGMPGRVLDLREIVKDLSSNHKENYVPGRDIMGACNNNFNVI